MAQVETKILAEASDDFPDWLKLSPHEVLGTLKIFTGQQGEHWISIVPTLNVSGYGENEADAFQALKENLDLFFEDFLKLTDAGLKDKMAAPTNTGNARAVGGPSHTGVI